MEGRSMLREGYASSVASFQSSESSGRMTEHPSPTQFRAGQGEPLSMVRLATIYSGVFFR
jgi:hypothetical protein